MKRIISSIAGIMAVSMLLSAQPGARMDFSKAFQAGKDRRADIFRTMEPKTGSILFAGGSIMEDCEWKELFANEDILNRGIDGSTVQELVDRIPELLRHKPSKAFIEIGSSDLATLGADAVLEGTSKVADALLGAGAQVYVFSVLPPGAGGGMMGGSPVSPETVKAYNRSLKSYCDRSGATFLDMYEAFEGSDGKINPKYGNSNTKLSVAGYSRLREFLEPYVNTGLNCESVDGLGAKIWRISAKRRSGLADRTVNPTYFIYPDRPVKDPMQTVKAFGMENHIDEYLANVYVVNPAGSKYDSSKDLEVYYKLLERLRSINNLKLIGKGNGATFINNVLTSHDEMVSGILTIGGTLKSHTATIPVPAYVASSAKTVADYYISANNASAAGSGVYENPSHPVERVVVDGAKMTDAEAFSKAWKEIFSRNYRYNNYHTWYTGTDLRNTVPFEFVSYVMFDRLGIRRNIVEQNICGWGDFLWYEYIPERLLSAPKNSVPLVIMLHGNNNDPRTQAETSGFVELASEKGFIAAELEWQGRDRFAAMGTDGIEQTIRHLMDKYPQIDPSRVYCQGLSAGGMNTTNMCIFKTNLIAAGASMAGGIIFDTRVNMNSQNVIDEQIRRYGGNMEVGYLICAGTNDSRFTDTPSGNEPGNPRGGILRAVQTLCELNGITLGTTADPSIDPIFGMEVKDRKAIETKDNLIMHEGTLYKGNTPLVKMISLEEYGHWNYKGVAAEMWEFFTHYSRDPKTKKLIYHP